MQCVESSASQLGVGSDFFASSFVLFRVFSGLYNFICAGFRSLWTDFLSPN
jgi:hypothetical protein